MITDPPSTVFEKFSIDIMGPFCSSMSQYRYILTVQDLSNFLIAVPFVDQTAEQVAKTFVDHVVFIYGITQLPSF
jgi:steroid 5-alpha reductase family enzyme